MDNPWIKNTQVKHIFLYNSNFFEKKNIYTKSSNKGTMFQKQKHMEKKLRKIRNHKI